MYFDSLQALVLMDGHGGFVWSAYAVTSLVIVWLLVAPALRRKRIMRELRGAHRRGAGAEAAVTAPGEV
tara:strand:+ start:36018 stop:36224 length:207 start_codon:yes stop_codon:yes gene_type:complete